MEATPTHGIITRPVKSEPGADELAELETILAAALEQRDHSRWGTASSKDAYIGRLLLRVRNVIPKGAWLDWCDSRHVHPRTAQRLIQAAKDPTFVWRRTVSDAKRWLVWERDDFRCHYCGVRQFLETDHKIPVDRCGSDDLENIVTACQTCNRRKGTRSYEEFIAEIGGPAACRQ